MVALDVWDYVSMTTLVSLTCAVGLYQVFRARKLKQTKDFLVSNKELGVFSLVLSIVATIISAVGILGNTSEMYITGISFTLFAFGWTLGGSVGSFLFLPVFYHMDKHTIFEYLELRFCSKVRIAVSMLSSFQMIMYTSCVIYAPALALNQVTGLHQWASVTIIGVICVIYTSMGGLKAVVWSDVTQVLVMTIVFFIMMTKGLMDIGGINVVWDKLIQSERSDLFILIPSSNVRYSSWTLTVGAGFYSLSNIALNQSVIQRCLSTKSLTKAKSTLILGSVGIGFFVIILSLYGLLVSARYADCDPLIQGLISKRDQLAALYAIETLSFCKGLAGVFIAGLLCATISTLSSMLNSLSAITLADYVRPFYPQLSNEANLQLSKILTIIYGVICVVAVAGIEKLGGIISILFSINSLTGGPLLVIFTVGMLLPWVTTKAAVIGVAASFLLPWWAWFGNQLTASALPHAPYSVRGCSNQTDDIFDPTHLEESPLLWFYSISSLWYPSWSLGVGLSASLIAGKIIGFQDVTKVDPCLVFPFVRRFLGRHKTSQETKLELTLK